MKVILQEKVKGLGVPGDVVEVAEGYGRNYLIPRHLAVPATAENLARLEQQRKKEENEAARVLSEAEKMRARIDGRTVALQARAGENGKLFGSITAQDIAEGVRTSLGVNLDRRKLDLPEPIKTLGLYPVVVRLHPQVQARIMVQVTSGS